MSAINTSNPASTTNSSQSSSSAASGFAGLTANDFMTMLVTELQTQDPTQPMSNSELLTQLSQMTQLQSATELSTAITSLTTTQQLSAATSFIGKVVAGTDANKNPVSGVVTQAFLQNGSALLGVGNSQIPLANVTGVAAAS